MASDGAPIRERARAWQERLNRSRHPLWVIAVLSFLETIIIPVPIELVLIPMMAASRQRIWLIATMTTLGCLAGALVGYSVGLALYESAGRWFIEAMAYESAYQTFKSFFERQGFLAILVVGIVPIPFQVAMITAGAAGYPFHLFVFAALIARSVRYYGLAWLVLRYGKQAHRLWQRHALATSFVAAGAVLLLWFAGQLLADQVLSGAGSG